MSQRYQSFILIIFGFFAANILTMNHYIPVFTVAEEAAVQGAKELLFEGTPPNLASFFIGILDFRWEDMFINRLPSVLLMILAFISAFFWGKKVFGKATMITTMLVMASSLVLVNVGKFATSDAWLFCFQLLMVLSIILYLKQPSKKWHLGHAVCTLLAMFIYPIGTLILNTVFLAFLMIFHKDGMQLRRLWMWLVPSAFAVASYFQGFPTFSEYQPFFVVYGVMGIGAYLLLMIYGVLPWFAFLPPGMRHNFRRFRHQREELSVIVLGAFAAGLVSMSLIPQFVFALVIAKQLQGFFHEKYPYHNLVKIGAVIHLLLVVFGAMILMVGGWQEMQGLGFRSMMVFTTIYWFASFLGVVGIFSKNRRMIMGSMALAGVMVTFMFWGQIFPLLEAKGVF